MFNLSPCPDQWGTGALSPTEGKKYASFRADDALYFNHHVNRCLTPWLALTSTRGSIVHLYPFLNGDFNVRVGSSCFFSSFLAETSTLARVPRSSYSQRRLQRADKYFVYPIFDGDFNARTISSFFLFSAETSTLAWVPRSSYSQRRLQRVDTYFNIPICNGDFNARMSSSFFLFSAETSTLAWVPRSSYSLRWLQRAKESNGPFSYHTWTTLLSCMDINFKARMNSFFFCLKP